MSSTPPRRRPALRARLVILRGPDCAPEVLLALHRHPAAAFWCFPGGGVERGESAAAAAVREAREETGLDVVLNGVCYVQDRPDADALDIFFSARHAGEAAPLLGNDPERPPDQPPVLTDLRWVALADLSRLDAPVLPAQLAQALTDGRFHVWGRLPAPHGD